MRYIYNICVNDWKVDIIILCATFLSGEVNPLEIINMNITLNHDSKQSTLHSLAGNLSSMDIQVIYGKVFPIPLE